MNCMGSGGGATLIGGIRVADWALGLTYGAMLLVGFLLIASSVRAVFQSLMASSEGPGDERVILEARPNASEDPRSFFTSSKANGWSFRRPLWTNYQSPFFLLRQSRQNKLPAAFGHQIRGLLSSRPNELTGAPTNRFSWLPQSGLGKLPAAFGPQILALSESLSSTTGPGLASFRKDYGQFIDGLSHNGRPVHAAVFNENEVRAAAGLTMALGAAAFVYAFFAKAYLPIQVVTTIFFFEFLVRVTFGLRYSPMGMLAHWMTQRQPPQWVSAKPKRFAWTLGLIMSLAMTIITISGIRGPLPLTICLLCLTLMWLEAVLGLCLGCEIHRLLVRRGWIVKDDAFEICAHGACSVESSSPVGESR